MRRLAMVAVIAIGCAEQQETVPVASTHAEPDLSRRSTEVAAQIEEALARRRAAPDASLPEQAAAAGELAMLYHAYSFLDAAQTHYGDAARLDRADTRWIYYGAVINLAEGRAEAGIQALEELLEIEPDHVDALIRLAEAALGLDRVDDARRFLQRAAGLRPTSARVALDLGRVALRQGDEAGAIQAFEQALELEPGSDSVHRLLAATHHRGGDAAEARHHDRLGGRIAVPHRDPLMAAVADLAQDVESQLARGSQQSVFGAAPDALPFYREAVRRDPQSAPARLALGSALDGAGDPAALRELEAAVDLAPGDAEAHYLLAGYLARAGDAATAISAFQRAVEIDPRHLRAWLDLGRTLERQSRFAAAAQAYDAMLEIDPQHPDARLGAAASLIGAERWSAAATLLRSQVVEDPSNLVARTNLGAVLSRLGDRAGAIEQLRTATRLTGPTRILALAHMNLGLLTAADDPGQAEQNLRRALELDPSLDAARDGLHRLRIPGG